jgi:hypothetical protein
MSSFTQIQQSVPISGELVSSGSPSFSSAGVQYIYMHLNGNFWDRMSVTKAVYDYVSSVLARVSGMKILLVDSESVGIISMVLSQSQILEQEVFLVEVIDKSPSQESPDHGNNMKHLKAVAILRPLSSNFLALSKELKNPRFSEYHLCMCSIPLPSLYISLHQHRTTQSTGAVGSM